ncbi:MAG: response regulator transcription factor [bacterium]
MKKILIVEDEEDINSMIVHHLRTEGYNVEAAYEGEEALESLERNDVDLAILDILLPGMDGWELCQYIRSTEGSTSLPILFLTALSSEVDRIKGFDLGCDDYLIKPFSPRELVSRVKAILRRSEHKNKERNFVRVGNISIDFLKHKVLVKGKPVYLTNSEFRILQLLVTHEGRVSSRDELLDAISDEENELELGNIDVHVHRLRQKIEEEPRNPKYLQTVRGVGYRFLSAES